MVITVPNFHPPTPPQTNTNVLIYMSRTCGCHQTSPDQTKQFTRRVRRPLLRLWRTTRDFVDGNGGGCGANSLVNATTAAAATVAAADLCIKLYTLGMHMHRGIGARLPHEDHGEIVHKSYGWKPLTLLLAVGCRSRSVSRTTVLYTCCNVLFVLVSCRGG